MTEPTTQTIAVIGAGTMGGGIAALCSLRGYAVTLYDPDPDAREDARRRRRERP